VVAKGVVKVTARVKALTSDVPEPYWMKGVFFMMVPVYGRGRLDATARPYVEKREAPVEGNQLIPS